MQVIEPEVYNLKSSFKWSVLISGLFFAALTVIFISIPFFPGNLSCGKSFGMGVIVLLGVLLFSFLSFYSFKLVKRLPASSVSIDSDGIWPSHRAKKEALIAWQKIINFKERPILQRLDLIGIEGNTLLHIEYQLINFEKLRDYLINKSGIRQILYPPIKCSKNALYHLLYFSSIAGFSLLGWYVGHEKPLLGYAGMALVVTMLGYEYVTTAYCLLLGHHGCVVKYPIKSVSFPYNEILSVNLSDTFQKGARHPEVHISIKNYKKPLNLKSLGIDAVLLYKNLIELLEKKTGTSNKAI
jgi:hypothetical protein